MQKTNELNALYEMWIGAYEQKGEKFEVFVKDGIVNETEFPKDGIKVLFALKDLHLDEKGREFYKDVIDMRKHVCDPGDGKTWNPIARWSNALLNADVKFNDITDKQKRELLNRIAFINLKKEAGYQSVPDKCVTCYAKRDWEYILEEIRIINPNVIIAGGRVVFDALREFVFGNPPLEASKITLNKKMLEYGKVFNAGTKEKPLYVVEYYHPTKFGRGSCNREEHHNNMLEIRKYILNKILC